MRKWLTPADAPTGYRCQTILIPQGPGWSEVVFGALLSLAEPDNWEAFGSVTADQAAFQFAEMLWALRDSRCSVMIGAIIAFMTETLPDGVLPCDGTQYDRVDYPLLYAVLPADLIVDADHFTTPQMAGRVPVGIDPEGDYPIDLAQLGGQAVVQLFEAHMPQHVHYALGAALSFVGATGGQLGIVANILYQLTTGIGGDESHDNMMPFVGTTWGIVAR